MKSTFITITFISVLVNFCFTQEKSNETHFGFAINSSLTRELESPSVTPTIVYYRKNNQLELGLTTYPFYSNHLKYYRRFGCDFSYKYFPNGIQNVFNLYLVTNINYTITYSDYTYIINPYISREYYLNLMGGFGFDVKVFKKGYIGTNVNIGAATFGKKSTNTGSIYDYKLFEQFYLDGAIRLNIGYRF